MFIIRKKINSILNFLRTINADEEGSISVVMAILFPTIITYTVWQNGNWQAYYIKVQTQQILDISTLGASTTGTASKLNNSIAACSIPTINDSEADISGAEVAYELLEFNAKNTLPEEVTNQIVKRNLKGMKNYAEQASGYMSLHAKFTYEAPLNLFFTNYTFDISSTARCQPIT